MEGRKPCPLWLGDAGVIRSMKVWLVAGCMLSMGATLMVACCVWHGESFVGWVVHMGMVVRGVHGNGYLNFKIASSLWVYNSWVSRCIINGKTQQFVVQTRRVLQVKGGHHHCFA